MFTNQHRRTQIKFMKKLCHENMNFEHIFCILFLHFAKHIDKPFKVLMRRANPEKIHLKINQLKFKTTLRVDDL